MNDKPTVARVDDDDEENQWQQPTFWVMNKRLHVASYIPFQCAYMIKENLKNTVYNTYRLMKRL